MPAPSARRAVALAAGLALAAAGTPAGAAMTAQHPKPAVSKIGPGSGPTVGGDTVTVTGAHFTHVKSVRFGSAKGTHVHHVSAGRLSVTAPAHHAGTVDVRVTTKDGRSARSSHDHYTYKVEPTSVAAPAPDDAARDPELRLRDIACPAAGDCTAVGTYRAKGGAQHAVIEHLAGGAWHATTAPEPVFAAADPKMALSLITCAAPDLCVAIGTYRDATDAPRTQGLIETYERAKPHAKPTWSGAPLLAPHNGLAEIAAVACSPQQSCAAVGSYVNGDVRHALLETYDPDTGWLATDAPLPLNGASDADSSLAAVDCPADGVCFAVGSYSTTGGARVGLLERRDPSGWTQGSSPPVGDERANPAARLGAISCAGASRCFAGGRYTNTAKHQVGLIVGRGSGEWTSAVAPVAHAAAADPVMSLTGVSCAAADACVAAGDLTDPHGHQVGTLLALTGGHWDAVAAPLHHAAANPKVRITDLACGRVAVGRFTDRDGHTRPLLERLGGQGWTGQTGPLPASAGHGAASVAAVACDPGGRAVAVGRYVDGSGRHRGMITRDVPA